MPDESALSIDNSSHIAVHNWEHLMDAWSHQDCHERTLSNNNLRQKAMIVQVAPPVVAAGTRNVRTRALRPGYWLSPAWRPPQRAGHSAAMPHTQAGQRAHPPPAVAAAAAVAVVWLCACSSGP